MNARTRLPFVPLWHVRHICFGRGSSASSKSKKKAAPAAAKEKKAKKTKARQRASSSQIHAQLKTVKHIKVYADAFESKPLSLLNYVRDIKTCEET